MPEWRNGRRAGFKNLCPKGRVGSTPTSGTQVTRRAKACHTTTRARFSRAQNTQGRDSGTPGSRPSSLPRRATSCHAKTRSGTTCGTTCERQQKKPDAPRPRLVPAPPRFSRGSCPACRTCSTCRRPNPWPTRGLGGAGDCQQSPARPASPSRLLHAPPRPYIASFYARNPAHATRASDSKDVPASCFLHCV